MDFTGFVLGFESHQLSLVIVICTYHSNFFSCKSIAIFLIQGGCGLVLVLNEIMGWKWLRS